MRGVLSEGALRQISTAFFNKPPSFPVKPMVIAPRSLAACTAFKIPFEFPLVLKAKTTSPEVTRASI